MSGIFKQPIIHVPEDVDVSISDVTVSSGNISVDNGIQLLDKTTNLPKPVLFNADSPQVCSQDYLQAIGEGDVADHSLFSKFGRVSGVNTAIVDLWSGAALYVFPVSAVKLDIVSTSAQDKGTASVGTGIQKVRIIGLDANHLEISEDITLNGQTIVTTTKDFLRINKFYAIQCGTSGFAIGTITAKLTGQATIYSQIDIGLTIDRQMIYTVPAGKKLYLTSIRLSSGIGGTAVKNEFCIFTAKAKTDGVNTFDFFLPLAEIGVMNNSIAINLEVPVVIPEKTDLKMSVVGDSAQGALCTASVRGWIE